DRRAFPSGVDESQSAKAILEHCVATKICDLDHTVDVLGGSDVLGCGIVDVERNACAADERHVLQQGTESPGHEGNGIELLFPLAHAPSLCSSIFWASLLSLARPMRRASTRARTSYISGSLSAT